MKKTETFGALFFVKPEKPFQELFTQKSQDKDFPQKII